mmetsp:Transcript_3878/g.4302  ORF Transcript_3878/g.4302 Transcript_3878/m.4302 type:complete len:282 (-) Transcript_3878:288-1133(-)
MTSISSAQPDAICFNPIDLEVSLGRIEDDAVEMQEKHKKTKRNNNEISSYASCDEQQQQQRQSSFTSPSRPGVTRTSSRTPFLRTVYNDSVSVAAAALSSDNNNSSKNNNNANNNNSISLLKPYPISETNGEIIERRRLSESVMGFVSTSSSFDDITNDDTDEQSRMEVTVMEEYHEDVPHNDDFVLSAEENISMNELDTGTIQDDPFSFWETPVVDETKRQQQDHHHLSMEITSDIMSSVPFSVSFSSSSDHYHHHHDDPCAEEDENADASPIRSIDMEW